MIENAGLGVTMKESTQEVMGISDYVTNSNNDDGVADVLKRFCLN